MEKQFSPLDYANQLEELWSPRVISEVDNYHIKVAKLKGELTWHSHEGEDELFMVLKGALTIQLEHEWIHLKEGDIYIVPKGVIHNPIAKEECLVMLFEKKDTQHTGDVKHKGARSIEDQLRPLTLS
jgi:mannose-6-phosphate isomerase-like protein (cupin superfamily)